FCFRSSEVDFLLLGHEALEAGLAFHRAEGDGIAAPLDGGNAVLPLVPRLALHPIQGARRGIERKTLPSIALAAAKAESAGARQRQPEHLVEMRLVAMPADADTDIVVGAEHLADAAFGQFVKAFDLTRDRL